MARTSRTPTTDDLLQGARHAKRQPAIDHGTVALALAGMSFYWFMPAAARNARQAAATAAPAPTEPDAP